MSLFGSESSSEAEHADLERRQANLQYLNRVGSPDTIVAIPSLSFSEEELRDIKGITHYETRGLWQILAAAENNTAVIYITTQSIPEVQIQHLAKCHPAGESILERVQLIHLETSASFQPQARRPLSERLLESEQLISIIKDAIKKHGDKAVLSPFVSSQLEIKVANALDIPLLGVDQSLLKFGNKSEGRAILAEAGVPVATGVNNLYSEKEIRRAISGIWKKHPDIHRLVVKLNEGVSGMGNAKLILPRRSSWQWKRKFDLDRAIQRMSFEAPSMDLNKFMKRISEIGGVVEAFVRGKDKLSPSAQGFVHPNGEVEIFSTHDQVLGGKDGNVFMGAVFPAEETYRIRVQDYALKVGKHLAERGVIGPYAVDFLVVRHSKNHFSKMDIYAIEINLRQGGTTHPYRTARALCGANYDLSTGNLIDIDGRPVYYVSNDNIQHDSLIGTRPDKLVEYLEHNNVLFDPETREGVVLHMLGACFEWGKFGATVIAHDKIRLRQVYDELQKLVMRLANSRTS